jgi:hypothetical protein
VPLPQKLLLAVLVPITFFIPLFTLWRQLFKQPINLLDMQHWPLFLAFAVLPLTSLLAFQYWLFFQKRQWGE